MIMGNRVKQLGYGTWETPREEGIRESGGTQSDRIYIEKRQATMAQWVALRPLFGVCARDTLYEGGGHRRKAWWRQDLTDKNSRPTWHTCRKLKRGGLLVGVWECSRTATGRERKSGWVIGMLVRRPETPSWANNLVCQSEILGRR